MGESKRLHLESSKQNYYIISLRAIIKTIFTHTHTKCTYERTQSTSETTARQQLRGQPNLTPRSSALLPVRITTARRPDHIRLSVLLRSRSTLFIVHSSSSLAMLAHGPPKQGHFPAILAGFLCVCVCMYVCISVYMCACAFVCARMWMYVCTRVGAFCLFVLSNLSTTCACITGVS